RRRWKRQKTRQDRQFFNSTRSSLPSMSSPICGNDFKEAAPATAISKNNFSQNFGNISRPCADAVKKFWPTSHTSTMCSTAVRNEQIELLIRSCNACAALLAYSSDL